MSCDTVLPADNVEPQRVPHVRDYDNVRSRRSSAVNLLSSSS